MERLGPYRIVGEIGAGGMSRVYLAERDDGEFARQVAIKVMDAGGADRTEYERRFRAERQILASFDHPGIARAFDGGVTDSRRPYLVMEHVSGQPLTSYCSEHELGLEERLELFISPSVLFKVEDSLPSGEDLTLAIALGTYDRQVIDVAFNGTAVGTVRRDQNWEPSTYEINIPADVLAKSRRPLPGGRILELDLEVPGARLVGEGTEQRRRGICLRRITLSAKSSQPPPAP